MMKNATLIIFCLIVLTGCAAHHEGLANTLRSCGFGEEKFSKFTECSQKELAVNSRQEKDYYTKIRIDLLNVITDLNKKVKNKSISQAGAYQNVAAYVDSNIIAERQQAQSVAAIVAVAAAGTAIAACANNEDCLDGFGSGAAGGGGGAAIQSYDGNCQCPNDIASDGRRCGAMSAYSRSGGATPYCPSHRVN